MEHGRNGGKPPDARSQENIEAPSVADIYRTYYPALLHKFRRHLPEVVAEELVQDVLILVFRALHRYDSRRSSPSTWVNRIADQRLSKYFRSRERRLRAERESVAQEVRPPGLDPAEREEVRRLLEHLGPVSHQIMIARYLLDLSTEEIAAELGLSPPAVRQRISRCLARLRTEAAGMSDSRHPDEFSPGRHKTGVSG